MQKDGDTSAERLRRQQKALAEFGLLAFRSGDLDEILHRAAALVSDGLDVRLVKIFELLPGGDDLLVRAGVGWKPGVVGTARLGAHAHSPAGYAIARDEPVISRDLAAETRFEIPDLLTEHDISSMANVVIAGENGPFGVLEVDAPAQRDFDDDDIAFLKNYANLLAAAVERHRSHTGLANANREQELLIQELAHRVKNMLAIVEALATQTPAEDPSARAFQEALVSRLRALARAETLVFEEEAKRIDLARLVALSTEPFNSKGGGSISMEGPRVLIPARSGRMLGLAMHELGTNSTKHGALSVPGGEVRIFWALERTGEGARVRLQWVEAGGPAVEPPERKGFGTRLLTQLISYELDGKAELNWAEQGLVYKLDLPVAEKN